MVPLRVLSLLAPLILMAASCTPGGTDANETPELPATSPAEVRTLLASSEVPVVLNVWASWCGPCRSEAPLLRTAHAERGDAVAFIGVDVRDSQRGARAFIAEFGLDGFPHLYDSTGSVPADLGGVGVPLTFFFAPGGELVHLHPGVIDERTLALQIDELLRTG